MSKKFEDYNEYEQAIISYINFHGDMCAGSLCQIEKLAGNLSTMSKNNVITLYEINQEAINAISRLASDQVIKITDSGETAWLCHTYDGASVLDLPIAKDLTREYKKPRWMPTVFGKGENFPSIKFSIEEA